MASGSLAKVQNKKGYSDLPTTDRTLSAVEMNDEEEEEHEYTNNINEARIRQYDIPSIVISNEKSSIYSTDNIEAKRSEE